MIETMIKMWDRYGFVYLQGLTGTLCLAAITVFFRHIDRNDFGHYAAFTRETISVVCAFLYLGAERHADTASIVFLLDFFTQGAAGENIGQFLYYHSAYYQCQLLCGRGNQSRDTGGG